MDWSEIANELAERVIEPVAVLDAEGCIRLLNAPMEKVLGSCSRDVVGRPWVRTFVPADAAAAAKRWFADAQRGAVRASGLEIVGANGLRLLLDIEVSRVGRGSDRCILMLASSVRPAAAADMTRDMDYAIQSDVRHFGSLRWASRVASARRRDHVEGRKCFEVLHGRRTACPDCPCFQPVGEPWPRIAVRRTGQNGALEVVTVTPMGQSTLKISVRHLPARTLEAILQARVAELATEGRLSGRERSVLTYLVIGRYLEDIAKILGIGVRTVKFHQANILKKLGADSRVDLIRLVL